MKFDIKTLLPHLFAILFLLAVSMLYFYPRIQGDVLGSTDNLGYQGMAEELNSYIRETGETSEWTTSMFGGMPSYQINKLTEGNALKSINSLSQMRAPAPIGKFFAASLCFYILMISLKVRPIIGVIGSLAFAYATFGVILYAEGHLNKYNVVAYFPLVIAGIVLAFREKYLLGGLLFALGMGLNLINNHVQMTYYFGLTILIYGVGRLITDFRRGELAVFGKATAVLVVGLILGVGSSAVNLMPTNEYVKETVRGRAILEDTSLQTADDEDQDYVGFGWDRAMSWSNGNKDVLASFIPLAAGGGRTFVDPDTPYGRLMRNYNAQPTRGQYRAPLYHGDMSFTVGPKYFGIVVLLLFFLGILMVRGPLMWWMTGGSLLIILISMGKNAAWFNKPMFDNFPLFNKFRAPDSAMAISVLLLATLGMIGLSKWLDFRRSQPEAAKKKLMIASGLTLAIGVLGYLLVPTLVNFTNPNDAAEISRIFGGQADANVISQFTKALEDTRAQVLRADALRVLLFGGLGVLALFALIRGYIKETLAIGIIGLLIFLDFHGINNRYHHLEDYQAVRNLNGYFDATAADQQILQDPDIHYRVFNSTANTPFSDSKTSYLHKSIGGYHAAKLRRYDDLISGHLQRGNQAVYDMLNTKYYIVGGANGQPTPQRNPNALGNAWFVDDIRLVETPNEEFNALNNFRPDSTAIVMRSEFGDALAGLQSSGSGTIQLTNYAPNKLNYSSSNLGEGLAVFSEIWYGPDKGWVATIDGQPAEMIRVNYLLRGLRIPAGNHEIEMVFAPASYARGKTISLISSWLIILGLIGYGIWWYLGLPDRPADPMPAPAPVKQAAVKPAKPKVKRTTKKKKK